MKNKKEMFSMLLLLVLFILFIYYISKNISEFKQIFLIAPTHLICIIIPLIFLLRMSNLFFTGYLLDILATSFGIRLKLKESFGLAVVTRFYNTITPFHGGMGARAIYLKKKHDFAYVNFLATLSAIYIIIFLIGSFAGLISIFFIWKNYQLFNLLIFILFSGIFISMLSIIIFSPKFKKRKNKWLNRFIKVINGWHLIKNNKKLLIISAIISTIQIILSAISFILIYYIFDIQITLSKAIFLSSIANISILVSITPGNLGLGDAINVFSAKLIGIGTIEAISATITLRTISLLLIFILGPIFSYILLKQKS